MICPQCKAEYREGFDTCSDCSVPLVSVLSLTGDHGELVEVFQTLDQSEVLIIKSVLDEEGITYHFSGDFFRMSGFFMEMIPSITFRPISSVIFSATSCPASEPR